MLVNPIVVDMDVVASEAISMVVSTSDQIDMDVGTSISIARIRLQEKESTPSNVVQTIVPDEAFDGLRHVIINPIPSNYGLITWNGSTLTVS